MRLCILGSGSEGNCTLVEAGDFSLLIDAARLSQKYIKDKLKDVGSDIRRINAIIATHTHGDHIDPKVTFPICRKHDIPLYIHTGSLGDLLNKEKRFIELDRAGLLRTFGDEPFLPRKDVIINSFHVRHGGSGWSPDFPGRPVGFRITHIGESDEKTIVYTTDIGTPEPHISDAMLDADAVVIESNHDVNMEKNSRRHPSLVNWVLGPTGHLSNEQAADLVSSAARRSGGRLKHVVLAHLSRDCNTPEIALDCMRNALERSGVGDVSIHMTAQRTPSEVIVI